jgi:hypothetical protein
MTEMSALCKRLFIFLALSLVNHVVSADDCQPWQWSSKRDVIPGQVVCRYTLTSPAEVNYYSCIELADRYDISIDKFFLLNPDLDQDCKTIKPNTDYCVAGCKFPWLLESRSELAIGITLLMSSAAQSLISPWLRTVCVDQNTTMLLAKAPRNSAATRKPGHVATQRKSIFFMCPAYV